MQWVRFVTRECAAGHRILVFTSRRRILHRLRWLRLGSFCIMPDPTERGPRKLSTGLELAQRRAAETGRFGTFWDISVLRVPRVLFTCQRTRLHILRSACAFDAPGKFHERPNPWPGHRLAISKISIFRNSCCAFDARTAQSLTYGGVSTPEVL